MSSWVSNIGFYILLIGAINSAWVFFWYLLTISGTYGAKLSKKVGTDNSNTDQNIAIGENFGVFLTEKLVWRLIVTGIGALMYFLG